MEEKQVSIVKEVGDKKVRYTKVDFVWHFIELYLEQLKHWCYVEEDKGFAKLFGELLEYVYSKTELPTTGDILDEYLVFEQEENG